MYIITGKYPIFFVLILSGILWSAVPDTVMTLGTNFWNQGWGGADPWKNGYDNAIFADSIALPDYNPWKAEFLDEISFYSTLRFMDYGEINNNQDEVFWSDRTKKEDKNQLRMALYWMIDLCNRTHSDLWICLPERSVADYWQGAAQLIKNDLDSTLKVYIEWSNETWNSQFSAYQTGIDSGKTYDLWFPGDQGQSWGEQRLSARYAVFNSIRIWQTFAQVFGDSFDKRVVRALCGSAANTWWDAALFNALSDANINPDNLLPDAFGIAPYAGGGLDGADADIYEKMMASLAVSENKIQKVRAEMNGSGEWVGQMPPHPGIKDKPLICYEAGQHIQINSASFAVNPVACTWYTEYLTMLEKYMVGPVMHYTHSGNWGNMAWGAKNDIGQFAGDAPKFIALQNWYIVNRKPDKGLAHNLTVTNGSGGGSYYQGMFVYVSAPDTADGMVFDKWIGDTATVTEPGQSQTNVKIPDSDITLTALYREPPVLSRLEAENATLTPGLQIAASRSGFSGSGYIQGDSFVNDNDSITFTIQAQSAGSYRLYIGYGGFYGEKYQYIHVNGTRIAYFYFPQTAGWEKIEFGTVDLKSGDNTISIVKSWGWMDVDFVELEGEGITVIGRERGEAPQQIKLFGNFPNPFNPTTTIRYQTVRYGRVDISIYDILGRKIRTLIHDLRPAGQHVLSWDGRDETGKLAASGVYFYRLQSDQIQLSRKMLMLH